MTDAVDAPHDFSSFDRNDVLLGIHPHAAFSTAVFAVAAVTGAVAVFFCIANRLELASPVETASVPLIAPVIDQGTQLYGGLFAPDAPTSPLSNAFVRNLSLGSRLAFAPQTSRDDGAAAAPETALPTLVGPADGDSVPLPVRRPAALRLQASQDSGRTAGLQSVERTDPGAAPASTGSGFFERLFGSSKAPTPALAYAAPDDESLRKGRGVLGPLPGYDRQTAVYDISARTVYLPNGTRLEAHSGLAELLDDPRYVSTPNRGATPPQVYDLTLREKLFHGVQALRMSPVGGGGIFGRTGLLAHTYMLGPNGDSNGCVSFRNYDAFLQAFQRGEIKRLAVVTHLNAAPDARQLVGRADTN